MNRSKAAAGSSSTRAARASSSMASPRAVSTSAIRSSLVAKLRHTVPTPTPARWAMSSIPAWTPNSANTSSAAASTRARLRRASARSCRSTGISVDKRDLYSVCSKWNCNPSYTSGHPPTARRQVMDPKTVHDRRWWTLAVLCLSLVIVFVGNASLNVAIPVLSRELHATTSELQWVVAIYSLVFAGLLFSTGALGDRFGRKGVLQLGLLLYLVGAALATKSTAMGQLIACRGLMGAAAALIMPSTLSILINVFPAGERAKAIAIWASFTGAAGAIGPPISGWLLGHFCYHSLAFIIAPLLPLSLSACRCHVSNSREHKVPPLNPVGA